MQERRRHPPSPARFASSFVVRGLAALLFLLIGGCFHDDIPRPLVLKTTPVRFSRDDPKATTQGRLTFRGGLDVRSSDDDFGGLSALLVSPNGETFVAVTDEAHWVTGSLEYKDGRLVGAIGGQIAPMLGLDGLPLHEKSGDAEGLATGNADGSLDDLFVSFEGKHRVWRYSFGRDGVAAVPVNIPMPPDATHAPRNGGLEGLTRIDDGRLLAVNERYLDLAANYRAWILPFPTLATRKDSTTTPNASPTPDKPSPTSGMREVSITPRRPFVLTDVRKLPNGDILTLERDYSASRGVRIELRRIARDTFEGPDKRGPLDGEIIASFNASYAMDNMEGLSTRVGPGGETLIYLVSDDNFNRPLQRTLLMMYELN